MGLVVANSSSLACNKSFLTFKDCKGPGALITVLFKVSDEDDEDKEEDEEWECFKLLQEDRENTPEEERLVSVLIVLLDMSDSHNVSSLCECSESLENFELKDSNDVVDWPERVDPSEDSGYPEVIVAPADILDNIDSVSDMSVSVEPAVARDVSSVVTDM